MTKLMEECGEVIQVCAKIIALQDDPEGRFETLEHWDGTNLTKRLEEELGDLAAAIDFFTLANHERFDLEYFYFRRASKVGLFRKWNRENRQ